MKEDWIGQRVWYPSDRVDYGDGVVMPVEEDAGICKVLEDDDGHESRYRIVGPDELDLKTQQISIDAPLARALIGKALDAEVRVQTPTGEKAWYIVAIEYP